MTLLEILPDEQAWQQKYGDADEDDVRRIPTRHWSFSALICHKLRGSLRLLVVVSTKRMRDNQFVPIADESDQRKDGCAADLRLDMIN